MEWEGGRTLPVLSVRPLLPKTQRRVPRVILRCRKKRRDETRPVDVSHHHAAKRREPRRRKGTRSGAPFLCPTEGVSWSVRKREIGCCGIPVETNKTLVCCRRTGRDAHFQRSFSKFVRKGPLSCGTFFVARRRVPRSPRNVRSGMPHCLFVRSTPNGTFSVVTENSQGALRC